MIDVYHNPEEPREVAVNVDWINRFIGIDLSEDEIIRIFERLFLTVENMGKGNLVVKLTEYRQYL